MKDNAGCFYISLMIIVALAITLGSAFLFEAVATSDLPLWLKWFILK